MKRLSPFALAPLLVALTGARYAILLSKTDGILVASPPALSVAAGDTVVLVAGTGVSLELAEALGGGKVLLMPQPDPTLAEKGLKIMDRTKPDACSDCHSTNGENNGAMTFERFFGRTRVLSDGTVLTADTRYIVKSVRDPRAQAPCKSIKNNKCKTWDDDEMPKYTKNDLSDQVLYAIIAGIRSIGLVMPTRDLEIPEGEFEVSWSGGGLRLWTVGDGLFAGANDGAYTDLALFRAAVLDEDPAALDSLAARPDTELTVLVDAYQASPDEESEASLEAFLVARATISLAAATKDGLLAIPGVDEDGADAILAARDAGSTLAEMAEMESLRPVLGLARGYLRD